MAALRTYDIIRALDVVVKLNDISTNDIQLYAYGLQGAYAQMAAALDERITNIKVTDGMCSYMDWVSVRYYDPQDIMSVIIPGTLKYFDLPDLDRKISENGGKL